MNGELTNTKTPKKTHLASLDIYWFIWFQLKFAKLLKRFELVVFFCCCCLQADKNAEDPQLVSLINLTAIAIKRVIQMVKKINAFKNMCQEDQVALLKGGCTEMMILRSAMQYDVDHSIWKIPHSQEMISSMKSDVLKLAKTNTMNLYEEYENFIQSFDPRLRKDENVILIMSAIALFKPNRAKTIHTDVLIMEQVQPISNIYVVIHFVLLNAFKENDRDLFSISRIPTIIC